MIVPEAPLLPSSIPTSAWIAAWAGLIGMWFIVRGLRTRRSSLPVEILLAGLNMVAATAGAWVLFGLMDHWLSVDRDWAGWPLALFAGVALEVVLSLYAREKRVLKPLSGWWVTTLRSGVLIVLILLLLKPSLERRREVVYERHVAVLVDDSASMRVVDVFPAAEDKLKAARLHDTEKSWTLPGDMDAFLPSLMELADELRARAEWLDHLRRIDRGTRRNQFELHMKALHRQVELVEERARYFVDEIDDLSNAHEVQVAGATQELTQVRTALREKVQPAAERFLTFLDKKSSLDLAHAAESVFKEMEGLHRVLRETLAAAGPLNRALVESYYTALPESDKTRIDALVQTTRGAAAQRILNRDRLLEKLGEKYAVRSYLFGRETHETNLLEWVPEAREEPSAYPPLARQTDLAAAFDQVEQDLPERLSGVLVLSDGRNTAGDPPAPSARRLKKRGVHLAAVGLGQSDAPLDAAVLDIHAPSSILVSNAAHFEVALRFDRLEQQEAKVSLLSGGDVVEEQTLTVLSPTYRTALEFSHTPTNLGLHEYTVRIEALGGEQFETNNVQRTGVYVTDRRDHVLVVDGRPRWEARYLRNVFAERNPSVQLQYALLHPDRVAGQPPPVPVPASATRPPSEIEANTWPEDQEAWNAFDLVILGDVRYRELGQTAAEFLKSFVNIRGGVLVIIAGPEHMPDTYRDSPLSDLLPMSLSQTASRMLGPSAFYHIRLTDEGLRHPVTRLEQFPQANRALWRSFPRMTWRHAGLEAKAGASVLAYAEPLGSSVPAVGATGAEDAEERLRIERERRRKDALIAVHDYGAGKVMMLSFDRTWRMRYHAGDKHHYRFWGQVVGWATADKLPVGTAKVRLGTDRFRYEPDQTVTVRALLLDEESKPIKTDELSVEVFSGEERLLQAPLAYVPDSKGFYRAELNSLPPGRRYRAVLKSESANAMLAREGVHEDLETEWLIASGTGGELAELRPDPTTLKRLVDAADGRLLHPLETEDVLDSFGPGTERRLEIDRFALWNTWGIFALIITAASLEWMVRKRNGLA